MKHILLFRATIPPASYAVFLGLQVRDTSHKPDEIYGLIERLSPGTRKLEIFGRQHNVQKNWLTLGNQLEVPLLLPRTSSLLLIHAPLCSPMPFAHTLAHPYISTFARHLTQHRYSQPLKYQPPPLPSWQPVMLYSQGVHLVNPEVIARFTARYPSEDPNVTQHLLLTGQPPPHGKDLA